MPVTVNVAAPQVVPRVTPQVFSLGMLAGDTRTQTVTVANIGFATWTNVNVMTPSLAWVKVDGMQGLTKALGTIPPGGSASFTLTIAPPSDQASQAYAQNPLVDIISDNFQTIPVNAAITVTSARNAGLYFNVTNADKTTYDATRFIADANITLTSLDIAGLSLTGKTNAGGFTALTNVPAGKYNYRVEAAGAQPISNTITVEPGLDQTLNILLPTSMVTYKWSVTPTTIVDKYDITLDVTFKSDVPAPAIVISPPLETINMAGGQTVYTQYTITNKSYIAVKNFTLDPAQSDPAVHVELPYTTITEIGPWQTITVPVKITLDHASTHEARIAHKGGYMCAAGAWTDMTIEPWKAIVGDTTPSGNPTMGTNTGSGSGVGGNTVKWNYSGATAADAASVNADVKQDMGCGGNCINGTTLGCGTCKSCQGGICQFDASNNSSCITDDVCKKATCINTDMGKCDITDNGSETNLKVDAGEIDILSCRNRSVKDGHNPYEHVNGCGGEGGLQVNPRPVVCAPDIDFTDDCNKHDACYGTCNQSKDRCDTGFKSNMMATCFAIEDASCRRDCETEANRYYMVVSLMSQHFWYEGGQTLGCVCCQ